MRILAVDLGRKRIGLAISDERGEIAFPAGMIESRGRKRDLAALRALIEERQIGAAVIGLPLHMDGRRGPEAEAALSFAAALAETADIPVDTLDERWTSIEAERILSGGAASGRPPARGASRGRKRRAEQQRSRGTVDEMAASILLRTYLEQRGRRADAAEMPPRSARKEESEEGGVVG